MVNWGQWGENDTLSSHGTSSSTLSLLNLPFSAPSSNESSSAPPLKSWCKPAAVEGHYSTDIILKEIDRAFKDARGETSSVFGVPRLEHGIVAIRDAIRRNIEDLLKREKQEHVIHWGSWNVGQEKNEGDVKNAKESIQDAQIQALEYRVKILEGLLLEKGER